MVDVSVRGRPDGRRMGRSAPAAARQASDLPGHYGATVAGLGLLVMVVLSFASFAALNGMVVAGDAFATARNFADHEQRVRLVAVGFLAVAVLDLVVAWGLYAFFAPVSRGLALVAAWLRVAYAALVATVLVHLLEGARLAAGAAQGDASVERQVAAQVMASVHAFNDGWDIGLVFIGLHLVAVGVLALQSGVVPRAIGLFLMIAGGGYLIDSLGRLLWPGYTASVTAFTFVGEVFLMGWLLWRGQRLPGQAAPAAGAAGTESARAA